MYAALVMYISAKETDYYLVSQYLASWSLQLLDTFSFQRFTIFSFMAHYHRPGIQKIQIGPAMVLPDHSSHFSNDG